MRRFFYLSSWDLNGLPRVPYLKNRRFSPREHTLKIRLGAYRPGRERNSEEISHQADGKILLAPDFIGHKIRARKDVRQHCAEHLRAQGIQFRGIFLSLIHILQYDLAPADRRVAEKLAALPGNLLRNRLDRADLISLCDN